MKYISTLLLLSLVNGKAIAQTIQGRIERRDGWENKVYLIDCSSYQSIFSGSDEFVVDSANLSNNGEFTMHLNPNKLYRLNIVPEGVTPGALYQTSSENNYAFFVTGTGTGTVRFEGNMNSFYKSYKAFSTDNKYLDDLQKEIARIREFKEPVFEEMKKVEAEFSKIDKHDTISLTAFQIKAMKAMQVINNTTNQNLRKELEEFENPLTLSLALTYAGLGQGPEDFYISKAKERLKKMPVSPLTVSITEETTEEEVKLTQFISNEYSLVSGGKIKLDTITSQFILLDFWASWCAPCRKSITTLLKPISKKYNTEKLTIVGISIDKMKESAESAISKDQNPFIQIFEPEGGELYNLFHVKAIPYCVLINRQTGAVIKDVRPELIDDLMTIPGN